MNPLLRSMLYFFVAVVLGKVFGAFTSFFVAKFLTPGDYGIWGTITLISTYSTILCFGTVETLLKQYPYYIGTGDVEKARRVEDGVYGSIWYAAILIMVGTLIFHFTVTNESLRAVRNLILFVNIATALGMFFTFYYFRFTAHQNFKIVSILDTLLSVANFLFLIGCSYFWHLKGTVAGNLLAGIIMFAVGYILNKRLCGPIRINMDLRLIWSLIKIGFPITIVMWIFNIQTSLDRVISMWLLGSVVTGYYYLGSQIISTLVLIPMVVGRVLAPKINEEVGRKSDKEGILSYVYMPALSLAMVTPLFVGFLLLVVPYLYETVFPKYFPGLRSAQILLLGSFFACLVKNGINYLVAIDKQRLVLEFAIVNLIFNGVVSIGLVKAGYGIDGIAWGTTLASLLITSQIWYGVFSQIGYPLRLCVAKVLSMYLPFGVMVVVVGGIALIQRFVFPLSGIYTMLYGILFIIVYITMAVVIPPMSGLTQQLRRKAIESIRPHGRQHGVR